MALKMLCGALAVALTLPQLAMADVTYSYTGAKFNDVNVLTILDPEVPPDVALAQSAAVKAMLLTDNLGITLTTPVHIPTGWSTISYNGIGGELSGPLYKLQADQPGAGVNWTLTNSTFGGSGHIQLDNFLSFDPWVDSRLTVSLHVGAANAIDAWEITMLPSDAYGPPNWNIAIASSSTNGDSLLYEFGAAHEYQHRDAATTNIGSWAVSGSPVAPVPEPGADAMLLAGLAMVGAMLRKRRASPPGRV